MMFFDTITSQSNAQNTNLANNIVLGSTDTDFGGFTPVNETKPEFKSSNDLGMSMGFLGGTAGSVGMSRGETIDKEGSTYDGYNPVTKKEFFNKDNILLLVGIALAVVLSGFSLFKSMKKG